VAAPPADGEPSRRRRSRKPTEEVVALRRRNAQLEAALKEAAPFLKRGAELEEENAKLHAVRAENAELKKENAELRAENAELSAAVARYTLEIAPLRARTDLALENTKVALENTKNSGKVLARMRKGKVSENIPYRACVLADGQLQRDIRLAGNDLGRRRRGEPAKLVMDRCKTRGIRTPTSQEINRWLKQVGLIE
jgi:hypothetical protein